METVKVELEFPKASYTLSNAAKKVIADVAKALDNGWQPWDDSSSIVQSVTANFMPLMGEVSKVPGEFTTQPLAMARLGGLLLGELAAAALAKKGK
jgi:hypothetical protein